MEAEIFYSSSFRWSRCGLYHVFSEGIELETWYQENLAFAVKAKNGLSGKGFFIEINGLVNLN